MNAYNIMYKICEKQASFTENRNHKEIIVINQEETA